MMETKELISIFCQRPQNFAWFLGAGASHSSGLPTAMDIIWDLKKRYYCREENQDIDRQDIRMPKVRARIQGFIDSKNLPASGSPEEYSAFFEIFFGEDREQQRKYIADMLHEDKVSLTAGSRVIGALLSCGYCKIAFTTNFDKVVEKSFSNVSGNPLSAFHLEGSYAANEALNNQEFPVYCKLHGDFQYNSIKNLASDLKEINRELSKCLITAGNQFGFIVAGYSGRDNSVMEAFNEVLESHNPFPHGLFWTGMKGYDAPSNVENLLEGARIKGVKAEYVKIDTFDSLMLSLWRNIKDKPTEIDKKVRRCEVTYTSIPLPRPGTKSDLIRINALPVKSWTSECFKLTFNNPKEWAELKEAQRNSGGKLIFTKEKEVWCWGAESEIRKAFESDIKSIESDNLSDRFDNFSNNYQFQAFFLEGLCRALARDKPLYFRSDKYDSHLVVDSLSKDLSELNDLEKATGDLLGIIPGLLTEVTEMFPIQRQVEWAEAVQVSVEQVDGQIWLLLNPDVWIWPRRSRESGTTFLDVRKKDRRNEKFNGIMSGWVHAVLGTSKKNDQITVSAFESGSGAENPSFTIGTRTAYSKEM